MRNKESSAKVVNSMRINGINNIGGIYKPSKTRQTKNTSNVASGKDSFEVSAFAKELQVAKKSVQSAPDVRQARIDEIKQQMQAGSYNVSAAQVADKLVNKYFE